MIIPRDYQEYAVGSIFDYFKHHKEGHPIIAMPTGCHAKGHLILMYSGDLVPVEDIKKGDLLMGPDSEPREVINLIRGRQEMRRIVPNKSEPFVVNLDHKLLLRVTKQGGASKKRQARDEVVTIREYENGSNWYRHLRKLQKGSVEFPEKVLPLEPYFVGIMLGDGTTMNGRVSIANPDTELLDYFISYITSLGMRYKVYNETNEKCIIVNVKDPLASRTTPNRITNILRNIGVSEKRAWEKEIPFDYKTGSRDQRLQILAGLIDTDGYYDSVGNCFEYTTTSEKLAKDTLFIVNSLGLRGKITKNQSYCNQKRCKDHYAIYITGDLDTIPTLIKRKKARKSSKQKDCKVMGFTIEKLPEDDFYGFELSGDKLYLDNNFVIHHNSGKAVVIAIFAERILRKWSDQKIVVATHVKELVKQNFNKFKTLWPTAPAGIYSAGLGRRDRFSSVTFAGIGTIYRRYEEFKHTNLLIVDECDLISPNDKTMYRTFINGILEYNPKLRVIGLTATPWRTKQGSLIDGGLFTDICFDMTGIKAFNWLIDEGYLLPLVPRKTSEYLDVSGVKAVGGEYNQGQLQLAVDKYEITKLALQEAIEMAEDRKSWLVFCAGVEHSIHCQEILQEMGVSCGVVHSGNKQYPFARQNRDQSILDFQNGVTRAITNNSVLSVGYDNPKIDFIIHLAPRLSSRRWVQELGRGTRPDYSSGFDLTTRQGRLDAIEASDKQDCLVADFGHSTKKLGPINDPVIPNGKRKKKGGGTAPVKECPNCNTYIHASVFECFHCGYEFPRQVKIQSEADESELIKKDLPIVESFKVDHVTYNSHTNKASGNISLRVTYFSNVRSFVEYIPLELPKMRRYSELWWAQRSGKKCPDTVKDALNATDGLNVPKSLNVWINKKYPEIVKHIF